MSKNSVIKGIGYYVPPKVLTNADWEKMVDTSNEWIIERSGIEKRHVADEFTFTSDMAAEAAKNALANAKMSPEDIDFIIVATVTADMSTPSASCMVQSKIGAVNAAAIDINAACTGFIYALSMADMFIKSGMYKNILVIGAENMTRVMDWKDRKTCVLFGDGAGAAIVSATDEDYGIKAFHIGSDGVNGEVLTILNHKITDAEMEKRVSKIPNTLFMDGSEVFKFAVRVMVSSTYAVLEKSGMTLDDVDLLIPHQANVRIIDGANKRLKMPLEKIVYNIKDYGNMSAASIPIALCKAVEENRLKDGDNLVMVGFGGGLSWASIAIKWKEIK